MYYNEGWLREEIVAILIISHLACFLLGRFVGVLFAGVRAMASYEHPQPHSSDRCEFRAPTTEDLPASEQAGLTSSLH
jgi:hypothetical protein